jgi:hypothetical protein
MNCAITPVVGRSRSFHSGYDPPASKITVIIAPHPNISTHPIGLWVLKRLETPGDSTIPREAAARWRICLPASLLLLALC